MKLKLNHVRDVFSQCDDVIFYDRSFGGKNELTFIYCESLFDKKDFNDHILPEIHRVFSETKFDHPNSIKNESTIKLNEIKNVSIEELNSHIFTGKVVLWFERLGVVFFTNAENIPSRQTEESHVEVAIRGPKDGLVENIETNIGLIRKRLTNEKLALVKYTIGTKTKTKVGLLYDSEKITPSTLTNIQNKLNRVRNEIEELVSATQLEEVISDKPYSIFPLSVYTGRPDFITSCLVKGRFVILIDGLPGAIVAPATLTFLLKTAEDNHFNYISSTVGRILRFLSLGVAIFLPSFYVALAAFHLDQIPFRLLTTISITRIGVPFTVPLEMFMMLFLMEVFREAGYRLPTNIGQSITVVGGLIIGDAAIRAGLTSPTMVVIVAVAIVGGSTLISQTLTGTVSVLRYISLIFSSVLGMFGFFMSVIFIISYLSTLTSFGAGYLEPISPLYFRDMLRSVILFPGKWSNIKPKHLRRK